VRLAARSAIAALCAVACHHVNGASPGDSSGPSGADQAATDSVVGRVQLVGSEPFPRVVLIPDNGALPLTLIGPPTPRRVDGLDVSVVGRIAGSKLFVTRFAVVAANGAPATDGRLVADGDTLYIVTADGVRHALVNPSPNLRANVGRRVWVSGPLDQEPIAYGVIE
jgi:hypothetical protein